jgi:PAS domain S-box-containing protein
MARIVCCQESGSVGAFDLKDKEPFWSNSNVSTMDTLPALEAFDNLRDLPELQPSWPELAKAEEMALLAEVNDNVELHGGELIFAIDKSGDINEWSSRATEMTGFAGKHIIGFDVPAFVDIYITSEVQMQLLQVLENAQIGVETIDFEFPFYTLDARRIQMLLTTVTRRDEAGEIIGAFCLGKEIAMDASHAVEVFEFPEDDQCHNDEDSLVDPSEFVPTVPEKLLAEVGDSTVLHGHEVTFGIDESGRFNEWSSKAMHMTGLLNALEVLELIEGDQSYAGKDSSFRPRELKPSWSELAKAEEMALLAEVNDSVELHGGELIFGIDISGHINEWSSRATEMTGFTRNDAMGSDFVSSFITPDVQMQVHEVLEKARVGVETIDFEFPFYTLDARRIQMLLTTVTRRDEAGEIVGAFFIGKEMTDSN